jgi:tetratricopeptide (TPR) repeat protein
MYKWNQALIGEKILSKEAKSKLYHPKIRSEEDYSAIYAYGWDVSQTDRNTRRVWHNGTNRIFYADFIRFIDEGITLIMLSNKSNPSFDELNLELSRMIFDRKYKPNIPIIDNEKNQKYSQAIIETILNEGIEVGKNNYKKRGKNTNVLEYILNKKGYELLSKMDYDKAINIFTMNVFAYPKSANAFDSLGEAYLAKGNKLLAIKYYERSLELNPNNGNAIDILKELKK